MQLSIFALLLVIVIVLALAVARARTRAQQTGGNPVWGHGIPIAGDDTVRYGKRYGQNIPTLSSMNMKFGPECCPSQYSTDRGCVCYSSSSSL